MDFNTIVITIGKNPELTVQANNILALIMVENTKLLINEKSSFGEENIRLQLENFRTNLEVAEIIPAESGISLIDLYEKIVRPVRMNRVK